MSPDCPTFILESEVNLFETQIRVFDWIIDLGNVELTKRESILADFGEQIRARAIQLGDFEKKIFLENRKFAILPNSYVDHINKPSGIARRVYQTELNFSTMLEKFSNFLGKIRFIGEFRAQFSESWFLNQNDDPIRSLSKLSLDVKNDFDEHLPISTILGAQICLVNRDPSVLRTIENCSELLQLVCKNPEDHQSNIKAALQKIAQTLIRRHQEDDKPYSIICESPLKKTSELLGIYTHWGSKNYKAKWKNAAARISPKMRWKETVELSRQTFKGFNIS